MDDTQTETAQGTTPRENSDFFIEAMARAVEAGKLTAVAGEFAKDTMSAVHKALDAGASAEELLPVLESHLKTAYVIAAIQRGRADA